LAQLIFVLYNHMQSLDIHLVLTPA
jgi:hypothetical protein